MKSAQFHLCAAVMVLVGCGTEESQYSRAWDTAAGVSSPSENAGMGVAGNMAGSMAGGMAGPMAGSMANIDDPMQAGTGGTGGAAATGGSRASAGTGGAAGSSAAGTGGDPSPTDDAGTVDTPGVCAGETPHGCYTPDPANTAECPPQIPEQTEGWIVPGNEWTACGTPGNVCSYDKPDGTGNPNCFCDTGVHWICAYQ